MLRGFYSKSQSSGLIMASVLLLNMTTQKEHWPNLTLQIIQSNILKITYYNNNLNVLHLDYNKNLKLNLKSFKICSIMKKVTTINFFKGCQLFVYRF